MIYECIGVYAKNAYHIPELSVSVHSFEELCFVINENLYELGDYIMKDEVISFVKESLALYDLAERLYAARPALKEYVRQMLSYRHYAPEDLISKACSILEGAGSTREYVRLISRGDFLCENRKYKSAIIIYEHAREEMDKGSVKDETEYKRLMQKLGRLYALYYLFEKASECFSLAGDKKRTLFCRKLSMSRVDFVDLLIKEGPDEDVAALIEEYTKTPVGIDELKAALKETHSYGADLAAERLNARLKAEYRRI